MKQIKHKSRIQRIQCHNLITENQHLVETDSAFIVRHAVLVCSGDYRSTASSSPSGVERGDAQGAGDPS